LLSTTVILNLLRAKPWRFVEDIAGDELPMREGDDSYVFISVNDQAYRVTARVEQMQDLEKQGYVVMQRKMGVEGHLDASADYRRPWRRTVSVE
jgi:hypothetical protein